MKKKVMMGCLFMSVLLLGACQKSNTDTTAKSTKQTNSIVKKSSSSSATDNISSLDKQNTDIKESSSDESNTIKTAQKQLMGKRFFMVPALYDDEDANQAMEENKAPQNLMHDGGVVFSFTNDTTVHVELAGTYRPDYDTTYKLTDNKIIIEDRNIPYAITNGLISFDSWETELNGHTITWSFSPEENSSASSSENSSDTNINTKNLTSEQFKEWVSAVLDKQFTMGRHSFPYKLSVENHDGYAYIRVKHSELQVDTITMFRINSEGQLEEEDRSNGFPVTYKVVSSKFMDTSEVTVNN